MNYFLLAASKHEAALYRVSGDDISVQTVEGMPHSMDDVTEGDEKKEATLQPHGGPNSSARHGHDVASEAKERDAETYYRELAHSIEKVVKKEGIPLIFAGVPEAFGMFRSHDKSGMLVDEHIDGNPDRVKPEDLKNKADDIAQKFKVADAKAYMEQYGNVAGTGLTSDDIGTILNAATSGKVELLLVAEGVELWGNVADDGTVSMSTDQADGDTDFVKIAIESTLEHKGTAAEIPTDLMPENTLMCAILRL